MQRRTLMLVIGLALLAGTMVCMASAVIVNLAAGVNDGGSPELAAKWQATLTPLTPSDGNLAEEHPGLAVITFPNGDWVIGFARNSHGLFVAGGGTVVVKDSRGDIRAFFGHVCGPNFLQTFFRETPDVDGFFARLHKLNFAEHALP